MIDTKAKRIRRHKKIRKKINGSIEKPRVSIYRSLKHVNVQFVNDIEGKTLYSLSTAKFGQKGKSDANIAAATKVGSEMAKWAKDNGITQVVFDRSGYRYHGKVKAIAEALREGGLNF